MLTYKGLTVPYVACWSSEQAEPRRDTLQLIGLRQPDGQVRTALSYEGGERPSDRDRKGVLWLRQDDSPGRGTPMFAALHAARQRRCMMRPACQVCGFAFKKGEQVTFLLAGEEWADGHSGATTTAPVCRRCIPIAVSMCPHLSGEQVLGVVTAESLWACGVLGDHVDPVTQELNTMTLVAYTDPRILTTYAKQQAIWLEKPTWTDLDRA